ncbi:MAG: ABC transporter ATP-binding protein [Chloroflexi bacterium]|nr:ABC transporter ATP-binding protein [Chloroflexota bacterium]
MGEKVAATQGSAAQGQGVIELRHISKSFTLRGRSLPVLEDVSLTVNEGEFVSLVGPSGCGKSTLLSIISGLDRPTQGLVLLNGGVETKRLGNIAYMPQKDLLLPWRTVLDNAALGPEVQGCSRAEARRRAGVLLETFGLQGFEREYPHNLSGGMRQRVAFLRTILAEKPVILLDEPFGALDALTRAEMQAWLLSLWGSLGKTIILVTHDVEEAVLLSHRVYVLTARPGRVKQAFPVPLPWPRRYEMVTTAAFAHIKASILDGLWQAGPVAAFGER